MSMSMGQFNESHGRSPAQFPVKSLVHPLTCWTETTPMKAFMLMFPQEQLEVMLRLTNERLTKLKLDVTKIEELLKWFGVLILATRFEFGSRSDLWSTTGPSKYIDAPAFGKKTGMSRNRFDELWRCVRWSEQPAKRPAGMSTSEKVIP